MDKLRIRVVVAEIERDGRYLIGQRRAKASMPLLWEFPGGRAQTNEADRQALCRELVEKLAVESEVGDLLLESTHEYEIYVVELRVYRTVLLGEPQALGVRELRWVHPDDFYQYEFPSADQRTMDQLLRMGD